ncbi:FadR/GntR family transcriptional regulator [Paenisporosarcina sp. TG20]|uniref:FadR/GntR family transcriptional regulator n=1 Tax=Paenisporosarcina sp. TG20 TaxID=1211706 RepID=UPI000309F3D7|nr:FadR/GntR family transcriptional regulator [Paenisporosarcina sp. TG20]
MNVEKISTKKVSESVAEEIERLIKKGMFQEGEKLPSVRELCELFGVGRSAVRDAITTLGGKGIVYVKRGEGTYIREFDVSNLFNNQLLLPSADDIKELFQVRKILETGIAEKAAQNRSDQDLFVMERYIFNSTEIKWESDYHFHLAIAKSTHNEILIQFMQFISATMKKAINDFHHYIQKNPDKVKKIESQHYQIYEAIKKGDPDEAHRMMSNHLDFVEVELMKSHVLLKISDEK